MSDFKIYENIQNTLNELFFCTDKNEIEKVFNNNKITDLSDRIELIRKCMGVEEVFNSSLNKTSLEEDYYYELDIFIEGSWRLLA